MIYDYEAILFPLKLHAIPVEKSIPVRILAAFKLHVPLVLRRGDCATAGRLLGRKAYSLDAKKYALQGERDIKEKPRILDKTYSGVRLASFSENHTLNQKPKKPQHGIKSKHPVK